jgi:hypothetical protein
LIVVGSALADPLTDVGDTVSHVGDSLTGAGVPSVDVPPLPQVQVPHTGVQAVDGAVDTVNDTINGATDTVNEVTGSLGGGDSTEPPASTPPAATPTDPSGQPVDTGSPAPSDSGTGPAPTGQSNTASNGDRSTADGGGGAAAGGAAGAAVAGAGVGGDRTPASTAPTAPHGESAPAPSQPGALITVAGALPASLFILTVVFAVIGVLMSGRSALRARRNRILRRESGRLRADVGAMQLALLPAIPERIGETDLAVAYRPAEGPAAGGDFHDVLALSNGRIGIVVGDVCGHGRSALANTALVHYTVRAYLEAGLEPREALRLTNEALSDKIGDDFVAAVAAVYDPAESTLDYATAGHPTPLIAGEPDRAVGTMTPPPIGVGLHTGHRQTRISVRPDSQIWFFTDGLIEARNADGDMVGREGLAAILVETGDAGPEPLLTSIAGYGGARDDMTAFVLAATTATGDGTIQEEIDVDIEAAASEGFPRFLAACGLDPGEVERAVDAARRRLRLAGSARIRTRRGALGPNWEITGAPVAAPRTVTVHRDPAAVTGSADAAASILTASAR